MSRVAKPKSPVIQRDLAISRGLVGAWLFNELGGSSTREISWGNKLATLNGPTWTYGHAGPALSFANNTYVDTNEPSRFAFVGGKFTTVMRIRPKTCPTHHGFLSTVSYSENKGWLIRSEGNDSSYRVVIGNNIYTLSSGVALNANVWMSLAITWISNGAVTSYYNGAYVHSVNVAPIVDSGRNLYIGKEQGTTYGFVGEMDSVLIYNRLLSYNEIRSLYIDPYLPFRMSPTRDLFAAIISGTTTVRLTWTDNSEGEDGFSIERKAGAGAYAVVHTTAAGVETWDDTSLPEGETYTYRVRATSAALGDSEYSNEVEVTV